MRQKAPTVSVVMAAYNAERFIGKAITSILKQTWKDFELIIVEDRSKDSTWQVIKKYAPKDARIRTFRNRVNMGGCKTLNRGMMLARGKYVAVMDNDDWSYPNRLKKQVAFLEKHPKVGIVGGTMKIIDENGKVIAKRTYQRTDKKIRANIFRYSPFSHPLIMMRRSVLKIVGYGNCDFAPADDYELYFRIGTVSKFANLKETVLKYRVVSGSMTQKYTKKMVLTSIKTRDVYRNTDVYRMNFTDYLFNLALKVAVSILPPRVILLVFNMVRNTKA